MGTIPIDMNLSESEDFGIDFVSKFPDSIASKYLKEISISILNKITKKLNHDWNLVGWIFGRHEI